MSGEEILYCNGVAFESGDYALPPTTLQELAAHIRGGPRGGNGWHDVLAWLQGRKVRGRGLAQGNPRDLAQTGWGVVFAQGDEKAPAIREALQPLLDHRREQVGAPAHRYQEYLGEKGYREGEGKEDFLGRHGAGPGPADPDRVPYYLMLIGEPAAIPYDFQYQLDVPYAVGRLYFETVEEYAAYARNVVQAETAAKTARPLGIALFGPRHPGDPNSAVTADDLITPLAESLGALPGCTVQTALGDEATKKRLQALLGNGAEVDLLFTAGHGIVLSTGHARQPEYQGALLCQGWPGPANGHGPLSRDWFLAGDDLDPATRLDGLIAFHFSCYSGGSPGFDDFTQAHTRVAVSPHPFVASLPQRLLAAGALAVVGHIERAWLSSVSWPGVGRRIEVFESTLKRLLAGDPLGAAMECFAERYAELSTELSALLQEAWNGGTVDDTRLASLWTASNDARNFTVLGDPAVRLRAPQEVQR
ncbi:MAG TPA: hypothetical protein VFE33_09985 [Thermoanaerobaculia bacterium]|nr:hypothetical protein [Thermoanaerobaculia bacterium]